MRNQVCESFQEALGQKSAESLADGLLAHAESCGECRDALRVARWLRHVATSPETAEPRRPLPSAGQLWWKAEIIRRLTEREDRAEKAIRPVRWSQWAALGVVSVVVTVLVAWGATWLSGGLDSGEILAAAPGWRGVVSFLLMGTVLPVAGFGAFWILWRDA